MTMYIIYATVLVSNMVSVVEYKAERFITYKDCVQYLNEQHTHVNTTLQDHLRRTETNSTVLFIGCSERGKLPNNDTST